MCPVAIGVTQFHSRCCTGITQCMVAITKYICLDLIIVFITLSVCILIPRNAQSARLVIYIRQIITDFALPRQQVLYPHHQNVQCALLTGLPRYARNDKGASSAKKTDYRNDTRARISVIARNEMTKQSSKYKSAPLARLY